HHLKTHPRPTTAEPTTAPPTTPTPTAIPTRVSTAATSKARPTTAEPTTAPPTTPTPTASPTPHPATPDHHLKTHPRPTVMRCTVASRGRARPIPWVVLTRVMLVVIRRCRPPVATRPTGCVRNPAPTASTTPAPTTARPAVGTPMCWGQTARRPGPSTAAPLPRTGGARPADKPPTRGNRGPMTRVPIRRNLMKVVTTTVASTDGGQHTLRRCSGACRTGKEQALSRSGGGQSSVGSSVLSSRPSF